jgi:HAD superfamily hydrolase (TIGR01450 family)
VTLADRFDAFLFDLDGVVWRGEEVIPGAARTIARLREDGKHVVFMTNNASRSPRQYAVKLMRLRIPTEPSDVVTSGHVVLAHLRKIGLRRGDRIHVCAAPALGQLLRGEGFAPTNQTRGVQAVVVAWNPKLTFEDIRSAADVARSGVPFIGANADATYPSEHGLLPGSGSILAAIETASGMQATVVGKPKPEIVRLALERAGSEPDRALVCGDRPETDVAAARAAGVPVALVLTGVTLESDLATLTERPDWILRDVTDLVGEDAEPESPSAGPGVGRRFGRPAEAAEDEDEDEPGDEPSDVREVRDPTIADLT